VTFKQSSGVADLGTPTGAITVVNGVGNGNGNSTAFGVTPVNGQVTFTVDSATSGSSVPVVYAQPTSGNALAVSSTGAPTGSFGIGGAVTWAPTEATAFSTVSGVVTAIDAASSTVWLDTTPTPDGVADVSVKWAAGDRYSYDSGSTTSDVSSAQFQSWLSVGDTLGVQGYNPGSSQLVILNDVPNAPTNVAASYVSTAGNVSVAFTMPTNPDVVGYDLQRATVTNGVVGSFATVTTLSSAQAATAGYKFTNVPSAGTFAYQVLAANSNGDKSPASNVSQATVPSTPAATSHVGAPKTLTTGGATFQDNNNNGNVDSGDILRLTFDERMAAPASDASLTLTDGNTPDATVGTVTNGVNSTWTLNAESNTIIITLTGGPVIGTGGTNPGIQYPATVTASTGVADTGAQNTGSTPLNWDPTAANQDVTF
jgi:hypothetical protein